MAHTEAQKWLKENKDPPWLAVHNFGPPKGNKASIYSLFGNIS